MIYYKGKEYRNFTIEQLQTIERLYPVTVTAALAEILGKKDYSVTNAAYRLGLKKDPSWYKQHLMIAAAKQVTNAGRFKPGQKSWNKGKKGLQIGGEDTQFKPGHQPHNTKYDGCIKVRRHKNGCHYKYIRVAVAKWELYHRHVWEQANGKIPAGHVIRFKDGDQMNCEVSNMEIISRGENMDLNTIHRYPDELKKAIKRISKIEKLSK